MVEVGCAGVALVDECFVVTAAGADRPRPTRVAVIPCADMMRVQKFAARSFIDATRLKAAHLSDW